MQRCRQHLLIWGVVSTMMHCGGSWVFMVNDQKGRRATSQTNCWIEGPARTLRNSDCGASCMWFALRRRGTVRFRNGQPCQFKDSLWGPPGWAWGTPNSSKLYYIYICHYLSLFVVSGETNGCGVYTPNMSANIFRGQAAFFLKGTRNGMKKHIFYKQRSWNHPATVLIQHFKITFCIFFVVNIALLEASR